MNIKRLRVSSIWRRAVTPETVPDAGGWTDRIFFISDTDLDRITDMDIDLPLSVLLGRHAKTLAQSHFLCDRSFLTYSFLLESMILRKKYSSSG